MNLPVPNPNHPKKGSTIKVGPIRSTSAIAKIKTMLEPKPRDYCFFVLGINTAYRASELASLTCGQVVGLSVGDPLSVYQSKTKKQRITVVNKSAHAAVQRWLEHHPNPSFDSPLFLSRSGDALTVGTLSTMVKTWCRDVELQGNYGSHSLRKTWGFHQLRNDTGLPRHMVLPILMRAYGHSRQEQTLEYLCIQSDEVSELFMSLEL